MTAVPISAASPGDLAKRSRPCRKRPRGRTVPLLVLIVVPTVLSFLPGRRAPSSWSSVQRRPGARAGIRPARLTLEDRRGDRRAARRVLHRRPVRTLRPRGRGGDREARTWRDTSSLRTLLHRLRRHHPRRVHPLLRRPVRAYGPGEPGRRRGRPGLHPGPHDRRQAELLRPRPDGSVGAFRQAADFSPTSRGWYKAAAESGEIGWTDIYVDFVTKGLVITPYAPVKDDDGTVRGVLGADVPWTPSRP
ncbi:MAG: cache domain-containing protein [Ignavibacteriales bacterium]|nr:cache domain-containing protein [Ignavibacteriales bacterium]